MLILNHKFIEVSFNKKKIRKINWQKKRSIFLKVFKNLFLKLCSDIVRILQTVRIQPKKTTIKKKILTIFIVFLLAIVAYGTFKIITLASSFSPKDIVLSIFSQKIKTDDRDHSNFLIVGIGGENHDGADLTDSIKIISINHQDKSINMISIPRDLWVYSDEFGSSKINELYMLKKEQTNSEALGMLYLSQKIEEITGISIHYRIKIDFNSFKQAVDSLGCIDVNVPESIYDPYYPKDGTYLYEPFSIKKGQQCIDGDTALKYARSRYSSAGGDFSRSERQALIIKAIKEKALSSGVLLNPKKLKNLYDTFNTNVYTDISWDEMVYLAKISQKFSSEKIFSTNINDIPHEEAGFLYTPPREQFGGASVLLPSYCSSASNCKSRESYSEIRKFINFFINHSALFHEQRTIRILNGTKTAGLASDLLFAFSRYGLNVIRYGNALNRETQKTKIYLMPKYNEKGELIHNSDIDEDEMLEILSQFLPKTYTSSSASNTEYDPTVFENEAEYIIVLGKDFTEFKIEHPELFYYWN